jgi:Fe2+ transport system protein B
MPPPQQPNVSQKQQLLPQTYIPPPPQTQFLSEEQQMNIQLQELQQLSHQRVPSRDISNDTTMYQQDVQIKPNYIPKSNMSSDYVRDYEELTEKNYKEYEKKKKDKNRLDNIMTEFQIPIFVAILFFSFQLPIINKLIFKKISFLTLYDADGNFNMYGLILKSVLFGGIYYSVFKIINFLVEL